jgi:hypothetical protein
MKSLGACTVLSWLRNRTAVSPNGGKNATVAPRSLSRKYVFCVTALAVFLAGMLLVRPRPISVSVEGTLRHAVTSLRNPAKSGEGTLITADPAVEVRKQFADPAWLDKLWLQVTRNAELARGSAEVSTPGGSVEAPPGGPNDWASQIAVEICPVEGKPGENLIHVQLLCAPQAYAVEFVDAILHDFQAQHNHPQALQDTVERREQLLAAQDFWQNQLAATRTDLETFLEDEFRRRETASKAAGQADPGSQPMFVPDSDPLAKSGAESVSPEMIDSEPEISPPIQIIPPPAAIPVVEVLNPEWNARASQLQAATQRRDELLRQVTEEHPAAQEATLAVQHLKAELASTPRTIPVTQPSDLAQSNSAIPPRAVESANPERKVVQSPVASPPFDAQRVREEIEGLATVKDLRGAIAKAEERLAKQKADLEALPILEESLVEQVEIVSPAKVVEHVVRVPSKARLATVLCLACAMGAFCMQCCPKPASLETFQRVEQVVESVRLPLRGPLPTTDGPAICQDLSVRWPNLAGRFVSLSEWTILATVALLLLSISMDPSQSTTLTADPLRAILTAVHRLSSNL